MAVSVDGERYFPQGMKNRLSLKVVHGYTVSMLKIRCVRFFLFIMFPAFLFPFSVLKPLRVMETNWFDILFPPESEKTAALVALFADTYLEDICTILETSPGKRMPILIRSDRQRLNGMYSPWPYSRLVLHDTVPTEGELAGSTNTILMVLYHELVHAVSLTLRSPVIDNLSRVFGDGLTVNGAITMPYSFIEGVTVSLESSNGQGRLNDPLVYHHVFQDALEGRFLSHVAASGVSDSWPGLTNAYHYGGFFSKWLQEHWGMSRYARLWREGASFHPLRSSLGSRFRQVYGISVDDAWSAFETSLAAGTSRVRSEDTRDLSGRGIHTALASGTPGLVWSDRHSGTVCLRTPDGEVHPLFDCDSSLSRLSISPDGRYVLASRISKTGNGEIPVAEIFDLHKNAFTGERFPGFRDAAFMGNEQICAVRNEGQHVFLVRCNRSYPDNQTVLYESGPDHEFSMIYSPTDAGEGRIAFILANGGDRHVMLTDTVSGQSRELGFTRMTPWLRYLSSRVSEDEVYLYFSWAPPGGMYRYGLYTLFGGSLVLQQSDISGGVFSPVTDWHTGEVVFISRMSGYTQISGSADLETEAFIPGDIGISSAAEDTQPDAYPAVTESITPIPFPSRMPVSIPYKAAFWFLDGTFIPLPVQMAPGFAQSTAGLVPGFIFATGDPAEHISFVLSPSFLPRTLFCAVFRANRFWRTTVWPAHFCL